MASFGLLGGLRFFGLRLRHRVPQRVGWRLWGSAALPSCRIISTHGSGWPIITEVIIIVLENKRTETPFAVRDNMLDVWKQITELTMRGFGKKKRKMPKIPKNFNKWSEVSQEKWKKTEEEKLIQKEKWDMIFIENETKVVDNLCREIVYLIDRANSMNPQYVCECDKQRLMQDEAIGLCNNLHRELNHIADTIPCNKNFLAIQTDSIEKEIALLKGWRKSCNSTRINTITKEIQQRKTSAEKINFIVGNDDINRSLDILLEKCNSVTN